MALGPLAKLAAFRIRKPPAPGQIGPARSALPERSGDDDGGEDDAGRMSFLDHLDELRRRLVAAALSLAFGTVVAFFFIDRIFTFIMRPLYEKLPAGSRLIYTEPTEAFFLKLKIALLAGVVIGAPLIMLQLWLFIAPGLYAKEKRFALPFILMASVFFVGGAAFNHYILFPMAWVFLAGFSTDYMMFMPRIAPVFSLYAMLMLAMGADFRDAGRHPRARPHGAGHRRVPLAQHQVRHPDHLHRLGRHHADRRPHDAGADGRADDRALHRQHRPGLALRKTPPPRRGVAVAIRRSAAAEIESLLAGLCGDDPVARETAEARLTVIGVRAIPHLIVAFDRAASAGARAAILKVLEATPDRRSAELGAEQLEADAADPAVRAAAVRLLGAYLESPESARVLDTLTAFILDTGRHDTLRLQALDVIERALPDVLSPLRTRLAEDPSSAIRSWASAIASTGTPVIDPRAGHRGRGRGGGRRSALPPRVGARRRRRHAAADASPADRGGC